MGGVLRRSATRQALVRVGWQVRTAAVSHMRLRRPSTGGDLDTDAKVLQLTAGGTKQREQRMLRNLRRQRLVEEKRRQQEAEAAAVAATEGAGGEDGQRGQWLRKEKRRLLDKKHQLEAERCQFLEEKRQGKERADVPEAAGGAAGEDVPGRGSGPRAEGGSPAQRASTAGPPLAGDGGANAAAVGDGNDGMRHADASAAQQPSASSATSAPKQHAGGKAGKARGKAVGRTSGRRPRKQWLEFAKAREVAHGLQLQTWQQWQKWARSKQRCVGAPLWTSAGMWRWNRAVTWVGLDVRRLPAPRHPLNAAAAYR